MAACTFRLSLSGSELLSVGIDVAGFARLWRTFELNLFLPRWWLVTIAASYRAMNPKQREFRFRMVEPVHRGPRFRVVTGLAAEWRPVWAPALHALAKLAVMRIHVTCRASSVGKMERHNLVGPIRRASLVAIHTRNGNVRASERILCLLVFCDGEERAMKIHDGVATLAAILIRSAGKLSIVRVLVTIAAVREFDFVQRFFAGWNMAFRAFHLRVHSFQRIF